MTELTEQRLRELFAEDAERAPAPPEGLGPQVVGLVRRRRMRIGLAAGLPVAILVAGAAIGYGAVRGDAGPGSTANRTGALPDSGTADCDYADSPAAVAARSVSFDGTVTAVNKIPIQGEGDLVQNATVTFTVHRWFRGGPGKTATAIMAAPLPDGYYVGEAGPSYTVGSRLLVSGEPTGGTATVRLQAWGCGYTRYYDAQTAAAWQVATAGR